MSKISDWFAQRRKSLLALAGLGLTYAAMRWGQTNEYVVMAIAVLGVIGVHEVPNKTDVLGQLYVDVENILHPAAPAPPSPEPGPVVSPTAPLAPLPARPVEDWGHSA